MEIKFGDIQETALVTLAIRASETSRPDARIRDEKAAEIIDALGVDVSKYDPFLSHEGVVARTIMFADALRGLIAQYPDALCINLGCGFDDKFSQVDNGQIEWFDVDLPDQIAVRRKVYDDRPRCTMLDGDALDGAWTAALPRDRSVTIVVMEGVLEYFTKEQTATCLHMLCAECRIDAAAYKILQSLRNALSISTGFPIILWGHEWLIQGKRRNRVASSWNTSTWLTSMALPQARR